jgi:hypothetical protein
LKSWETRPFEIANLLNPAFCGETLLRCIVRYNEVATEPFPYPLSYLVLPIVLHRKTREAINTRSQEQLHSWLQEHPEARVGFADRAKFLVSITKESLAFLLQIKAIKVNEQARIRVVGRRTRFNPPTESEVSDCFKKSEYVGRWLARAGNTTNIFTMWGVRP